MEKYESDETFIARWVASELSEEELSEFKNSEAYKLFYHINEEAQNFKAPPIDKRQALIRTKEQITFGKTRKRSNNTWYAIAASVAIILGVIGALNTTKSYETAYGEQLAITLPDGSTIQLNAGSELSHKRFFWMNDKKVFLKGEAFFNIQKSKGFAVETTHGTVSVLGTQFNIKTRGEIFELDCYEGVVRFDQSDMPTHQILRKNDRIVLSDTNTVINEKNAVEQPNWMKGISVFKEQPLKEVLHEMERQYSIKFQYTTTDVSRLFTGSFLHNNLETALKSTLTPLGINYEISEDKTTINLP